MGSLDDDTVIESPTQADLFGSAIPGGEVYVPDQRHVRNRLDDLLAQMRAATSWPWEPLIVRLHREKTFSYLCDLLTDRDEAAAWRLRIESEIARLDAAIGG
jgi:hypothetical protein